MYESQLDALIAKAVAGDSDASWDLAVRANQDPASIGLRLAELLRAGVLYPPALYLGSDDSVRRGLVDVIDRGFAGANNDLSHALLALAHANGDIAESAFRRWSHVPPPGSDRLYVLVADYTVEAGWVLLPGSGRRSLCGHHAYQLNVAAGEVGAELGVQCPFCSNPLWLVIDLDFADARVALALAHTRWAGKLRIITCQLCSCYGALFSEVMDDGSSRWSDLTSRPSYLPTLEPLHPVQPVLIVGEPRETPYLASAWTQGGSTLGGFPDWIQHAGYMRCPKCHEFMDHLALVGGADIFAPGEGAYYVGLHAECGIAGVTYQQS